MSDKFIVANEVKKYIVFVREIIINYPRKEYVLKDRLEKTSYEVLELVYFANMIENRLDIQKEILSKISMLDYYMEISYDKKFITLKKLNMGIKILNNIRKLVYGWIKSNEG